MCLEQRWPVAGEEHGGEMADLQGIVRTLGFLLREMVSQGSGQRNDCQIYMLKGMSGCCDYGSPSVPGIFQAERPVKRLSL